MPPSSAARLPRFAALVGMLLVAACDPNNLGFPAPSNEFFFPTGILLDKRPQPDGAPPKWLFVANGNNDLSYSSGTVVALDLDAFFAEWTADQETMAVDPYCGDERCVLNLGSDVRAEKDDPDGLPDRPCRRLALRPSVVECDERAFVRSSVLVGDFATLLTTSCESPPQRAACGSDGDPEPPPERCEHTRLWLPVRGDPSVTYMDLLDDDEDGIPELSCLEDKAKAAQDDRRDDALCAGEDPPPLQELSRRRCHKDNRLMQQRNDADLPQIERDPFHMFVSPQFRFGYVAHADAPALTIIALDGLRRPDGSLTGTPAIIESADVFLDPNGFTGGFGIAERPCSTDGNAPSLTNGCTRPLIYGGFRYLQRLARFTVQGADFSDPEAAKEKCLAPGEDFGTPGKINCDPRVRSYIQILPGGLDPTSTIFRATLGDIAFGDDQGDELLVVQTAPGALLKLDTSIGPDGEPFDTPSAPPIELCEEPTRMKLYRDGGQRFALISCFRAALIYIVDLDAFRVAGIVQAGTGPYEIEVDDARDVLYVGNSLERSISVIDLARHRRTRFQEIARIGLQEPFSR